MHDAINHEWKGPRTILNMASGTEENVENKNSFDGEGAWVDKSLQKQIG